MTGYALVFVALIAVFCATVSAANAEERLVDLRHAVVYTPPNLSGPEQKALTMLLEEVEKRTQVRWPLVHDWPAEANAVIVVGDAATLRSHSEFLATALPKGKAEPGREGYRLRVMANGKMAVVLVAGRDARGVLFGVGKLLRNLRMGRGRVATPDGLDIATTPHCALRGHQLGYRPKTNSYDAWTLPMWEQYIRDLAVFGANAVELIPPRSDDDADSPHFPLPPMETMIGMSRLLDAYGLDVWVWYPAMDPDYTDSKMVESAVKEWAEVLQQLPRVDAVFVPGGDPGHTAPRALLNLLEKQTTSLRRFHPKAQMWVSPQGFTKEWMDEFLAILEQEKPAWLTGLVFGPQVRLDLPELRARVPRQYLLRLYPDITHCRQCQYPVPDWDTAFALTEGREGINPRPIDEAHIFRRTQQGTVGFLTYSEGCNDDVNKAVWSALGWNPDADVVEILREYSRYFIGDHYTDSFAQGLLALECNWRGPLAENESVTTTLQQFQAMERGATPQDKLNWRFQQALYRAYYDAFVHSRLLYENHLEEQAMERLRGAAKTGALAALAEAETILEQAVTAPVAQDWRARVFELAEALYQSIRMQLSVERYQAIAVERGANLDSIDVPLNNRVWLKERFAAIRQMPEETARRKAIEEILHWTDPGPGGYYDEPGNPARRPHLVVGVGFEGDPGAFQWSRVGFGYAQNGRMAWQRHTETLFDAPLQMRYTHLDPHAAYKVRIVYGADNPRRKIKLVAGDRSEVHPFLAKPSPSQPLEFDIPAAAITNGGLTLTWTGEPGFGGNGRGCQVCEIWLIKK